MPDDKDKLTTDQEDLLVAEFLSRFLGQTPEGGGDLWKYLASKRGQAGISETTKRLPAALTIPALPAATAFTGAGGGIPGGIAAGATYGLGVPEALLNPSRGKASALAQSAVNLGAGAFGGTAGKALAGGGILSRLLNLGAQAGIVGAEPWIGDPLAEWFSKRDERSYEPTGIGPKIAAPLAGAFGGWMQNVTRRHPVVRAAKAFEEVEKYPDINRVFGFRPDVIPPSSDINAAKLLDRPLTERLGGLAEQVPKVPPSLTAAIGREKIVGKTAERAVKASGAGLNDAIENALAETTQHYSGRINALQAQADAAKAGQMVQNVNFQPEIDAIGEQLVEIVEKRKGASKATLGRYGKTWETAELALKQRRAELQAQQQAQEALRRGDVTDELRRLRQEQRFIERQIKRGNKDVLDRLAKGGYSVYDNPDFASYTDDIARKLRARDQAAEILEKNAELQGKLAMDKVNIQEMGALAAERIRNNTILQKVGEAANVGPETVYDYLLGFRKFTVPSVEGITPATEVAHGDVLKAVFDRLAPMEQRQLAVAMWQRLLDQQPPGVPGELHPSVPIGLGERIARASGGERGAGLPENFLGTLVQAVNGGRLLPSEVRARVSAMRHAIGKLDELATDVVGGKPKLMRDWVVWMTTRQFAGQTAATAALLANNTVRVSRVSEILAEMLFRSPKAILEMSKAVSGPLQSAAATAAAAPVRMEGIVRDINDPALVEFMRDASTLPKNVPTGKTSLDELRAIDREIEERRRKATTPQ